ncbi:MAG: hypothetical protein HY000_10945 [Planctomycetes bacterium]|nr:hypothetical protein [Planctomycetota bacterium]
MTPTQLSRRDFLDAAVATTAAGMLASGLAETAAFAQPAECRSDELPRVAAINSIYRLRSHAYHIAGRFIHGYSREGVHHQPPFKLVRMYNDQYPADDLGRAVCKQHGIELCRTPAEALGGERGLDVDAVLLIVEHGDYPLNDRGQILYPRYELFEQVMQVFRTSGRSVPVFCDKHLSYDHRSAAKMVAASREMGFGLMAGSSLPVTWRRPELEPPLETAFTEGLVAFGYDRGPAEIYLFHALECLQCLLERRRGGETGVRSVTCLQGDAVWQAADQGRWSWKLLEAALACNPSNNYGRPRENVSKPQAILVEYRDGARGTVLNLIEQVSDFSFAGSVAGDSARPRNQALGEGLTTLSTAFVLPNPPGAKFFDPLTFNIEKFFAAGRPPYPVERTLLTSTVLDWALRSFADGSRRVEDPSLDVRYQPPADSGFFRGRFTDV